MSAKRTRAKADDEKAPPKKIQKSSAAATDVLVLSYYRGGEHSYDDDQFEVLEVYSDVHAANYAAVMHDVECEDHDQAVTDYDGNGCISITYSHGDSDLAVVKVKKCRINNQNKTKAEVKAAIAERELE